MKLHKRLKRFLDRSDVRKNIIAALIKRIRWRFRWLVKAEDFLTNLGDELKIYIPQSGSASLIYYQGYSELETAEFVNKFLRPGMLVLDIGAHIGEYTLLAAQLVGNGGEVHSFEPQPKIFLILEKNIRVNKFANVRLNCCAVSSSDGEVEFEIHQEPSVSSIRKKSASRTDINFIRVPCVTLESYWSNSVRHIDLIKVDVEGAEKFVFEGAKNLLEMPNSMAPNWLFEYAQSAYKSFGYKSDDLLEMLTEYGYKVYRYCGQGRLEEFDSHTPTRGIINLIATKNYDYVCSLINEDNENTQKEIETKSTSLA